MQEALCESGSGGRSWVPLSTLPPDFRAVAKAAPDASDYGDLNVAPGTDSYSVTYNNRRNSCHVDAFLEAAYIVENTAPGWLLTRVRPQLQDAFTAAISAQSKAHARDKDSIRHLNETRDTFLEQLSVHTGTPVGEQGTFDRNWENTFISPKDIAIKSTRSCTTEGCLTPPCERAAVRRDSSLTTVFGSSTAEAKNCSASRTRSGPSTRKQIAIAAVGGGYSGPLGLPAPPARLLTDLKQERQHGRRLGSHGVRRMRDTRSPHYRRWCMPHT